MSEEPLLRIEDVVAGYGRAAPVLRGLTVEVRASQVVCLVGPNGAGKSTVLKVATGMLRPREGRVLLKGRDITDEPTHRLLSHGLAHVLQGHSVFGEMTVGENVQMGGYTLRDPAVLRERVRVVRDLFEVVGTRWDDLAGLLSGGQQKQVEFARAMMLDPDVVLMDEPSMGLDPKTTAAVFDEIDRLRVLGKGVLLVEQNARRALSMADIGCVLDLGVIQLHGPAGDLLEDPTLASLYLGGAPRPDPGTSGSDGEVPDARITPAAQTDTSHDPQRSDVDSPPRA